MRAPESSSVRLSGASGARRRDTTVTRPGAVATDPPAGHRIPAYEASFDLARMDLERPTCERFQVVRVGSSAKWGAASILDEIPSKRIADKCARSYRPATLVALRIGLETYETGCSTAELCRRRSRIADAQRHQLFSARGAIVWKSCSERGQGYAAFGMSI
jgi:hypothetical protein